MPSVLVPGFDPKVVPGADVPAFHAVLDNELARFAERGIDAAMTLLEIDGTAEPTAAEALAGRAWDVVVIGGGIRKPEQLLEFFERIVNLVRKHAPQAAIAFNTSGDTSVEAAERWL
ncbi:hypothetical protein [Streptomyces varsoviensis]|uniref:Uncharacterized protein n=1 Tax=Streptomyces varsoviensis TaxID=67373 RepID=A0ABR5IZ11_9ACTN|nr:hypothetical protein [Streptomyces varsoviensis]KOG86403.1 hypothetical protein ADK38_31225 [Streptomyces varsoviensis]